MIDPEKLTEITGVKRIRPVSDNTTVIEYENGGVRPATPLELKLWQLLLTGTMPA